MVIIKSKYKNIYLILFTLFLILLFSLSYEFLYYSELKKEEVYETKVEVLNIYKKENFDVLKLKNQNFTFFTSIEKNSGLKKLDTLNIAFLTHKLNFYDFLKGFYTKTIYYDKLELKNSFKQYLVKKINTQHKDEKLQELFQALFLAIPLSSSLRDFFSSLSLSHLIALSGFHLAVLSFVFYMILYPFYSFFHTRYFPYRNKRFDILLMSSFFLFLYLVFTGLVPSLLRAFVMLVFSLYLLRSNIKLFSFYNLFLVMLFIVALYPKYIFSLGLWFSFFGVFYIFLFLQYFKDIKSRIVQVLFFNFWIFFALNPIIHYFFPITSYEQLISPILTIAFTLFYPFELFLHLINQGAFFDEYLISFINMNIEVVNKSTSLIFFLFYIFVSFVSIKKKVAFWVLNIFILLYSFYLFY